MGLQHRVVFGFYNLMILVLRRDRREGKEGLVECMRLGAFWGFDVSLWRRGGGVLRLPRYHFEKIKKRVNYGSSLYILIRPDPQFDSKMPKRKASITKTTASPPVSWRDLAKREIASCATENEVIALQDALDALAKTAEARFVDLRKTSKDFTKGCLVKMTSSNQSQDQDVGYNMCSRDVDATFTAGPNAAEFSISFSNENVEGDETITVESDLFILEEGDFGEVTDVEITEFLKKAGLFEVKTRNSESEDDADDATRRRWAYADVISEAIELVVEKYGYEDNCGVFLGMGSEDIYGLLGLNY